MADVYQQLAHHLNRLPGGFPPTDNGVELKILKKLFTKRQAQVAMALTMQPEAAGTIAKRLSSRSDDIIPILEDMSSNGLIFKVDKHRVLYKAAQFVIGIWEYHVKDLDPELIRYFNEYIPHLTKLWTRQKTNQLRVIPVSKSIEVHMEIMPYEIAEEIIQAQSKIVVAPCICRKEHQMVGNGCDNPLEACLIFGATGYFYENNGLGRSIDKDEALEILAKAVDAGLVLQPGNAKKAMNICMCCGCCCQILKNLKTLPQPVKYIHANYHAVVDEDHCVGCGQCEARCHMDAITIQDIADVNLNRCIGCGICVQACDTEAITLTVNPPDRQWEAPDTLTSTYMRIAKERLE